MTVYLYLSFYLTNTQPTHPRPYLVY